MNAIAEIDKAGRLVVPKKMRDALHLVAGTRVRLKQEGSVIQVESEASARGLYEKDGLLVYDSGRAVPADAVKWLDEDREAPMNALGSRG